MKRDPTSRMNVRCFVGSLLLCWIALIFGTSCTVVRPTEFFDYLNRWVFHSDAILAEFELVWGAVWLLVVKGWHFAEFAILQILATRTLDWWLAKRTQGNVLLAALGCVAFAASDEWHQTFVPDRYGTAWDVFVDSLGVMSMAWWQVRSRRPTSAIATANEPT